MVFCGLEDSYFVFASEMCAKINLFFMWVHNFIENYFRYFQNSSKVMQTGVPCGVVSLAVCYLILKALF